MASGLPYDSDAGRAWPAAITAIMHGQAYLTSAEHAGALGPFDGFALNREPMLKVMEMHRDAVEAIDPSAPADLLAEARAVWDECLDIGPEARLPQQPGDGAGADRHDRLHDGLRHDRHRARHRAGQVQAAGRRRDAQDRQPDRADGACGSSATTSRRSGASSTTSTTTTRSKGRPGLKDEHLPVFDCAFAPPQGGRSIHYRGHLRMMAAVQPFLSGAISKTCNMPDRGDGRGHPRRLPRRLEAGPQGAGDLSRRLQGEPAGEHQVGDPTATAKARARPAPAAATAAVAAPVVDRRPRPRADRSPTRPSSSRGGNGCRTPGAA